MPTITIAPAFNSWPPPFLCKICSHNTSEYDLEVHADTQGQLIGTYVEGDSKQRIVTQAIGILDDRKFILTITADATEINIYLGGSKLLLAEEANGQVRQVETFGPTMSESRPEILLPTLNPKLSSTKAEEHFLNTLIDAQQRINSDEPYQLLKLSGLLRLLIIDTPCLVDIVNQSHRLKLQFTPFDIRKSKFFNEYTIEGQVKYRTIYQPFASAELIAPVNRNAFIKYPIIYASGKTITVEDVISLCAHKSGGVHFDLSIPNKPSQQELQLIDEALQVLGGLNMTTVIMKDIALIMILGVYPLALKIMEEAIKLR